MIKKIIFKGITFNNFKNIKFNDIRSNYYDF